MELVLTIPFFVIYLLGYSKQNKTFMLLVLLQVSSFFLAPLVANYNNFDTMNTVLNILFVNLNLLLITIPWSSVRFNKIIVRNKTYFVFFKKKLYRVLLVNLFVNIFVLIVVFTYISDIASFKSEHAFRELYETIPYFSIFFRYAFVSQNLGYLAIPIFFYHYSRYEYRKSLEALIYSCTSIIAGFAFYSRAQIITFVLVFLGCFLLMKRKMPLDLKKKMSRYLKRVVLIVGVLFLIITFVRFSAMDYYGDRIPRDSKIQNPIIYSLVDYTSQGYFNGINQLEVYTDEKNLDGEQMFRDFYQILNFFGAMTWNSESSQDKIDKAYNYDGGAFNGYTCFMVFNFGYLLTFIISFGYFLVVRTKFRSKSLSVESMSVLILLLIVPTVSIFYSGFPLLYFPFLFILVVKFMYIFKKGR